jgi:predicted DNA-binding transcriptional regulator AlpA
MNLPELLEGIAQLDAGALPAVLAAVAGRLATTAAPTTSPTPLDEPDTMLSTDEAAALLHRSAKWLYRHRTALPFARKLGPRSYVWSKTGLLRWLARQKG